MALSYITDLRAEVETHVGSNPKAKVHSVEWRKIQAGDPVEINPSVGFGYKTWCRGKKWWESETLCLDCYKFSWRAYRDPDFKTPEDYEKERWTAITRAQVAAA